MIQSLLATLRVEFRGVVTTLICAAVAASAALVGVLFIAVAIFIWASEHYGRLTASLAMAGFFILVAAIAVTVMLVAQNKARKEAEKEKLEREAEAKNAPPIWMDPSLFPKLLPMLLPIALKAGQVGLKHRGLLFALVSAAAVGWGLLRQRDASPADDEEVAEQPAE